MSHEQVRGVLVRVPWRDIEPQAGTYDFSAIDRQTALAKARRKRWSLAIIGGPSSPAWLAAAPHNVGMMPIVFRGAQTSTPRFWDATLQRRLELLATAVGDRYGSDSLLTLVYVPQMSANGIEGHFNGNTDAALAAQGLTEDRWVTAALDATRSFARAFPTKPVAIELHYILSRATAARRIMAGIEADSLMRPRAGVAIWWLSGRTDYQPELLTAFAESRLPIYGQLIDRADNSASFKNGDFTTAFSQARELGIRYVEPWEVDFTSRRWESVLSDFNRWALGSP